MRVRIIFSLQNKGAVIPFHHQYLIYQKFEELLRGYHSRAMEAGMYNFSAVKGQTKISQYGLHYFSSRVTIVFSSIDKTLVDTLINKLFGYDMISIGNMLLLPELVEVEEVPRFDKAVKYLAISPIVLSSISETEQAKAYLNPSSDLFSDLIYEATIQRMLDCGLYDMAKVESFINFQVVPDKPYLDKIANEEKKIARIYPVFEDRNKLEVRGYTFPFELHADPEVQQFIWQCGIGALNDKGFGMLDIATSDSSRQIRPYEAMSESTYLPR